MQLCLVIAEQTVAEASLALERFARQVTLFEIRADYLRDLGPDSPAILRLRTDRKMIFTARLPADGGRWAAGEEARLDAYNRALDAGFDFVDVEIGALPRLKVGGDARLIRSFHDMGGIPADIDDIFAEACEAPRELPKIAVTLNGPTDTIRFLEWSSRLREGLPRPRVVTAMGLRGAFSRILGGRLGILHTYVPMAGKPLLPGMVDIEAMRGRYRAEAVTEDTRVYGVLDPASSFTPQDILPLGEYRPENDDSVLVPFVLDSEEEARAVTEYFRVGRFFKTPL